MWKALLKKQLMEVNTWLLQNKKTGKKRSAPKIVCMLLLYVLLFGVVGAIFFFAGTVLCLPLVTVNTDWLYFDIMGMMAILMGVFGSVFNTYATLYNTKDNEFLLSMPIPPRKILAARLLGVWMWSFIYEAIIFVPALIVYWMVMSSLGKLTFLAVFSGIVLMLILSVFVLALSCILGWIVAKIGGKLKNKSIVTVLLSLVFFGIYYFCYSKAYEILQIIALNALVLGKQIKSAAYPLYVTGNSGTGDMLSLLIVTVVVTLLFLAVYFVMSRSFIKMATSNKSSGKKEYKRTKNSARSVKSALLFKELKRFTASSTYMLNCGLGTILLPIFGVFALVKGDLLGAILSDLVPQDGLTALIVCAVLCMMASMNDISSPSVSLEGKNLWLIQSFPVLPWQALKAKLGLHLVITLPPVLFCSVCVAISFRTQVLETVMIIILPALFVLLEAAFGLMVNLKSPNLKWTNETVPVKQSMAVMLSLFGGWAFVILLGALYFALYSFILPLVYLALCAAFVLVLTAAILAWIKNRGSKIFATL